MSEDDSTENEIDEDSAVIVIDNGAFNLRAGFAGTDYPTCVLNTALDYSAMARPMIEKKKREALPSPIKHGVIIDFDKMEKSWNQLFNDFHVEPENRDLLLTESIYNTTSNRSKTAEIMFEKFNISSFNLESCSLLAMYGAGRSTGCILDVGYDQTRVVCINKGKILHHTADVLDIGGKNITEYLQKLMQERGYDSMDNVNIVRDMQHKKCFITEFSLDSINDKETQKSYELPDGQILTIGIERCKAPEILFQPTWIRKPQLIQLNHPKMKRYGFRKRVAEAYALQYTKKLLQRNVIDILIKYTDTIQPQLHGISDMINQSIQRCDNDLRSDMYGGIVISGGGTMFPGIDARLHHDMTHLAPPITHLGICASAARQYLSWIGGSVFGSMPKYKEIHAITKMEYDEKGNSVFV
eukprot:215463_1